MGLEIGSCLLVRNTPMPQSSMGGSVEPEGNRGAERGTEAQNRINSLAASTAYVNCDPSVSENQRAGLDLVDCYMDVGQEKTAEAPDSGGRGRVKQTEIETFKQELAQKRTMRQEALSSLQKEMQELRRRVEEESARRKEAEEERDALKRDDLRLELEKEREERKRLEEERDYLRTEAEEKDGLERQVQALKDVSQIGKEMLRIRELQVKELKKKLVEINLSSVMAPPEDLRIEYEKQIENIRKLRSLYEERAAATMLEHQRALEREQAKVTVLEIKLSDLNKETEDWREDKKDLEKKIEDLEAAIENKQDEVEKIKDELFSTKIQNSSLNSQMKLINNLFSQMLVSPEVDLDRLTRLLKENHGLITDMTTNGDSNEVAALLVDLAAQVEKEQADKQESQDLENKESRGEIASNLSKVWRIMVELLSHHRNTSHVELAGGADSCYKCIQTPSGPKSVISVSQTFLTLKDLILEKNQLMKEVGRLKTLNNHLEHRLGSQEKRLSIVTSELRKTWSVVNKLKVQHKQLHTHEKILRYELQQKRCMLTELKEELELCKDKWQQAREKNSQTEEDWKQLRKEFAERKSRTESNSAESGYEEEDIIQPQRADVAVQRGSTHLRRDPFESKYREGSEPEMSEEDIEHSDGNSFDTVIDLMDISCIENQTGTTAEVPFILQDLPQQRMEMAQNLLPLTGSEFTDGLDQIESVDLAAILDDQYQTQLLGVDYNLSLPSSSASSPIPTENEDFASSEMDASEEDSSSHDNHVHPSPAENSSLTVPEESLLFGSNSSMNITKFLDGLFVEQEDASNSQSNLTLHVPSTVNTEDDNESATPIVNNNCYLFPNVYELPQADEACSSFLAEIQPSPEEITPSEQGTGFTSQDTMQDHAHIGKIGEKNIDLNNSGPSSSSEKSQEEFLNVREERLKRLEQQCRSLVAKVTSTSFRSEVISNKLDELHLCYGSSDEVSDVEEGSMVLSRDSKTGQEFVTTKKTDGLNNETSHEPTRTSQVNESNMLITNPSSATTDTQMNKVEENVSTLTKKQKTPEEVLEARAARLKRLEDQCKSLFSKMSATSSRSDLISNKLDELHDSYGPDKPSTSKSSRVNHGHSVRNSSHDKADIPQSSGSNKILLANVEDRSDRKTRELATESKEILNRCSAPGPSVELISPNKPREDRTTEEILEARSERFKRLEEQCKSLVSKMTATSLRSEIISNKLDELHSCYRSSEDTSENEEPCPTASDSEARIKSNNAHPAHLSRDQDEGGMTDDELIGSISILPKLDVNEAAGSSKHQENEENTRQTSDQKIQARSEMLNRVGDQCKSLVNDSLMHASSQTSDATRNSQEELQGQYAQPATEVRTMSPLSTDETGRSNSTNGKAIDVKNKNKTQEQN